MKLNNKKNEIIDISYNLFINNGYENTSVDEIISKIGIAKGTFYYYFKTKEEVLEGVIDKIIETEKQSALLILDNDMPLEQKLVGIIAAMKPTSNEINIADELNKPENIIMHKKMNDKLIDVITPIIANVINDGIKSKIFNCDNVEERIKLILIISNQIFDEDEYTKETIEVFIDTIEKILGTKKGTMMFIKNLIK